MVIVIWVLYNLGNSSSCWLYLGVAGKPERLENTLHTINHGFSKFLENSEAMPAYLFQIRATLGVRLISQLPWYCVQSAWGKTILWWERIWGSHPVPRMGRHTQNETWEMVALPAFCCLHLCVSINKNVLLLTFIEIFKAETGGKSQYALNICILAS